jgi:hypothetical protein
MIYIFIMQNIANIFNRLYSLTVYRQFDKYTWSRRHLYLEHYDFMNYQHEFIMIY